MSLGHQVACLSDQQHRPLREIVCNGALLRQAGFAEAVEVEFQIRRRVR